MLHQKLHNKHSTCSILYGKETLIWVSLFLFLRNNKTMQSDPKQKNDPGFLFSLNLMLFGGTLLLFVIITLNKLLIHYLSDSLDHSRGMLYSINVMESDSFRINNSTELYLTWFAFVLSLIGLIAIINKLVKTWKN